MNKKIIITTTIICIFLIIGGYIFWIMSRTSQQTVEPTENTGTFSPSDMENTNTADTNPPLSPTPQTGTKITIHTKDGDVSVKNFTKDSQTTMLDKKGDMGLKDDPNYAIVDYIGRAGEHGFNIALSGENLQTARDAAEKTFLQILGVSKTDACKLDVSMGVPATVSKTASGVEYHLSFCPNGIPLP